MCVSLTISTTTSNGRRLFRYQDEHTDDIEGEGDEAMVRGEWQQKCVNKDDVLEVVDQALAVEEVIRAEQKVPIIYKDPRVKR